MPRQSRVAQVFAEEWPRLVATLTRDLGDLGLAEEAAADAFTEAAARWGPNDTPDRPGAWLLTTARRKAIDTIRRDRRFADRLPALAEQSEQPGRPASTLIDDQLALIFGCCHASLNTESQIALTLRQVCGLSTGQIARAFLVSEATMAKRLVRAKDKIRKAGVPFDVPEADALPQRVSAVLGVIYLIFTEGHTSTDGVGLVRGDLCDEARWLADILARLLRQRSEGGDRTELAEVLGLAALMAFTDARRPTRIDEHGHLVLLENQDRSRWDRALIEQGRALLDEADRLNVVGPYQLQATIAGVHSTATTWADTDWWAIVWLYDRLMCLQPGPVLALNRSVALSMADGPEAGLAAIDELAAGGTLEGYRYLHAARADLLRRLDRRQEAIAEYRAALDLGGNEAERHFLRERLAELGADMRLSDHS
ncbi:MAG: DUF6596 domain-containing protein [Actinomycetota bacterium]